MGELVADGPHDLGAQRLHLLVSLCGAFDRWVNGAGRRTLPRLIHDSLDELKAVTAGR
jgi:hypothetical protein